MMRKFSKRLKKQHTWHDILHAGQNFVQKSEDAYTEVEVKDNPVDSFTFLDEFGEDDQGIRNLYFDDERFRFRGLSKSATCLLDETEKIVRIRCNTDPSIHSCNAYQADMALVEFRSLKPRRRNAVCQEDELERKGLYKYLRDYAMRKRLRSISLL